MVDRKGERMDWRIVCSLDSATYAPLQTGTLKVSSLANVSHQLMIVRQVLLQFDWMGTYRYVKECNVKIKPGESRELPDIMFTVDLGAPIGSHRFKPGISYMLLKGNKWVSHNDTYVARGDFIEVRPLPTKDFKVFISHSNDPSDSKLVSACREAVKTCGLTGYFAEDDAKPGFKLWDKIAREIVLSDAFLVLWTTAATKSGDMREEIGIAVGSKKQQKMVPIVEKGVEVFGSLKSRGIEWVDYHLPDHTQAISQALVTMMNWAAKKEAKKARLQSYTRKSLRTDNSE